MEYIYIHTHIYIYTHIHVCIDREIYIYIESGNIVVGIDANQSTLCSVKINKTGTVMTTRRSAKTS